MSDEKPINERVAVLETDMAALKGTVQETKDDLKGLFKYVLGTLITGVVSAVLLVLDHVLPHLGK